MQLPRLIFTNGFDPQTDAFEAEQRGYCDNVVVELPNGCQYRVVFFDPIRLGQSLKVQQELGKVCVGEPGLIVVPSVTLQYMQRAVEELFGDGYFESLTPLVPNRQE